MLLSVAFCYVLLTVTVTATWAEGDTSTRKLSEKHKRINKRDAAIFIDTMPIEPLSMQEPKIIYRRVSSQKYGPPKSKYSSPRGKPRIKGRYSAKKYKKHASPQYSYSRYSKRPSKSKPTNYRPHKWSEAKPVYGVPKKVAYPRYPTEPTGFGEPPSEYTSEYQRPMPYSEQPIDSYGAPVPTSIAGAYSNPQVYSENPKLSNHFEDSDHDVYREHSSWHTAQRNEDFDNNYAFTKKRPTFSKPAMRPFERPEQDEEEQTNVNSYPDLYNYKNDPYYLQRKKRPQYFTDSRLINKPWKLPKLKPAEDEFLVGGQYAEPPARYAKFQPSAPMYDNIDNEEDFAPLKGFEDSEVSSATISPYVNYKNSNMAFSPQNLNDAFSIVEK